MDPKDLLREFLERTSNFAFDPYQGQEEGFKELEPDASPLTFYDRHIDSKLLCRCLKDFSSLGPTLSKGFDEAITKFYNDGYNLISSNCFADTEKDNDSLQDARSLNLVYSRHPGGFAHYFPSKFYFHPDGVVWDSVFFLWKEPLTDDSEKKFTSECSLRVIYRDDSGLGRRLKSSLSDETIKKLKDIRDRYPPFANWLFCPMTPAGNAIVKQIQSCRSLRWETPRTVGFRNISSAVSPQDAEDGVLHRARILAKKRHKVKVTHKKASEETNRQHDNHEIPGPVTQKKSAYVIVSRRRVKSVRHYLDSHQYIQHAWATAAKQDSTFMVFNCGTYERIGIRHRESQTLYISPLIEPSSSRNPPYGKLHLGLHTAIVQDFLKRYEGDNQKSGQRHSSNFDDEDLPKAKRVKSTLPVLGDDAITHLWGEINSRELALVTLSYGPYCSPVPASFLRLGSSCAQDLHQPFEPTSKSKFYQSEYFELVLGEPLGEGAVGVVHPATLSLSLESGEILRHGIVVKLAFSEGQKTKLQHEYDIYSHFALAEEPVEGIVTVHGLFEDPDSGTLALFMEHGGQSLRELDKEQPDRDEDLRDQELESCIRALESIHKVGIRHRDLRPDNILISTSMSHEVSIIDFDCATRGALLFPDKCETEMERLEAIFEGEDVQGWHS